MPSIPPRTIEEILATGHIAPAFAAALHSNSNHQLRPGSSYTLGTLEETQRGSSAESLARFQKQLADSRPPDITETEWSIPLLDDWAARVLVCHRTADLAVSTSARPLVVLFHGGGHPERTIPLARELARAHGAVVVCPSYRLAAPPSSSIIDDAWETLRWTLRESRKSNSAILPRCVDPRIGFIVGGEASGATIAASLAHLARDQNLYPPLTGQLLCAGTFISPQKVPSAYVRRYLSREQNGTAPFLDADNNALADADLFDSTFHEHLDSESRIWANFSDLHEPLDEKTDSIKNGHSHSHSHTDAVLPPAYFQVCGMDVARDDSLIYERLLREEWRVPTRMDLYSGWGRCFWAVMPDIEMARVRMKNAVDGVGWLLGPGQWEEAGRL